MIATGVPPGLGEPVFDRLDADIAHAMMGINAVKAVEIGAGSRPSRRSGSEHRDELTPTGFMSNNAGGMLGGISSGQDILVHVTLKPTSSIQVPGKTIDVAGKPVEVVTTAVTIPASACARRRSAEAMLAHRADGSLPAPSRRRTPTCVATTPRHPYATLRRQS